MDFGLSEDQELLQASARDFLTRECPPAVVRQAAESPEGAASALDRKIAALGWTGLLVPESHGGLGLSPLDMALLLTEFGRVAAPGGFLFSAALATWALVLRGSAKQKKEWLPRLASGERTATLAWLEKSDRWDPAGIQLRARRHGSRYVLTGKKLFVPYAASSDVLVTPVRTSGGEAPSGVTLLLVERTAPGVSVRPLDSIDRTRRVHEVDFHRVEVGVEQRLGRAGDAWPTLVRLLDFGAVALAADGLGGSERVLEMAVDYSKTREQFGRPIGSFQAVKHLAAEMVADVEPARSLAWYAAYILDSAPREASRAASMAKARLSDVYAGTANRAVQIHGGIGFTWEHDIHFWFKRAKWNELAFGDATFHRERVAATSGF